jgi:uncharacterized membrane protein YoaT (DUF817 family)
MLRGEPAIRTTPSAARLWPPLARFIDAERRLGQAAMRRGALAAAAYEFVRFGIKQGWACLFGALMLALIMATRLWYPHGAPLARYDALVIGAVVIQAALLWFRLETWEEAKVILAFHVIGTVMELFKTSVGSWEYPEASLLRLGGVPLFSGFMYAAIGSYLARVWRLFDFRFTHHPRLVATCVLSLAIYLNFFTHHYLPDARWLLLLATAILFGRTVVYFKVWHAYRRMPLLLGFVLVALFIWFAENIGTFTGAWIYPNQRHGWALVPIGKLEAWFLLMIISYTLVSIVSRPTPPPVDDALREPGEMRPQWAVRQAFPSLRVDAAARRPKSRA